METSRIPGRGRLPVAFVVPLQGPTGIYGPSCMACGELATEQLNAGAGIAGLVGFLFGLGFDTATSVGLLLLSAGASQPAYAFIALPLIFAAGMTLVDSIDGVAMNRAYGWADSQARRYRYNLTVTAVSVLAALSIGTLTLINLASELR